MNEFLLIAQLAGIYGGVLLAWRLFGRAGLYAWSVLATVAANIEVIIQVRAFGMDMTLGNILFASTFLVTDILSEMCGRREANRAVRIGIFGSMCFMLVSQSWLWFVPSAEDFALPHMREVFGNTPRIMLSGLLVYAVVQHLDVFLYHAVWRWTDSLGKGHRAWLWVRNNGSTLTSQLCNSILFNFAAFWGVFPTAHVWKIVASTLAIFVATSLLDTPFIYLCRRIREGGRD
jgi:hypothetical protein